MTEQQQSKFEGWAIVDVLGHQRYVGFVTTEAYGGAVLFRVDVPALSERERTVKQPGYVGGDYVPSGTVVKEGAVPGYSKLIGAGSIYTITPCTEAAAIKALEQAQPRPLMNVTLPPTAGALPPADIDDSGNDDGDDSDGDGAEELTL